MSCQIARCLFTRRLYAECRILPSTRHLHLTPIAKTDDRVCMRVRSRRAHCVVIPIFILIAISAGHSAQNAPDRPAESQTGQKIPAISGVVVDAITGKPVAGVDVILHASLTGGDGTLHNANSTTSASGGFEFPPASAPGTLDVLSAISELSISVNHAFVSPNQIRTLYPGQRMNTDGGSDVSLLIQIKVAHDDDHSLPKPASQRFLERFSNRSYFPMSVQFLSDCHAVWNATCVSLSPYESLRLLLIPMLDNPAQCKGVRDAETREKCRQLNTYRAAFLHRDTIAEVRQDKRLCEEVDHGRISADCLERLHIAAGRRATPQASLALPPKMESIEKALILKPVVGLAPASPRVVSFDPFEEETIYMATYGLQQDRFGSNLFSVIVDSASTTRSSKDLAARTGGVPPGSQKLEVIDGNRVTTVEHDAKSLVAWNSGMRVVTLEFNHYTVPGATRLNRAVDAASASWPALIRAYLKKYPSSS
jgi:hypothetical protein